MGREDHKTNVATPPAKARRRTTLYALGAASLLMSGPSFAQSESQPQSYEPSAPQERDSKPGPGLGVYADLLAKWMIGTSNTHQWNESCPSFEQGGSGSWNPGCDTKAPMGVGLEGRLGLRLGYLGLEGIGILAGDWSRARVDEAPPGDSFALSQTMHVGRVGGGLGGGVRFLTAPAILRFTAGAGGGVMFRHVYSNVSSLDGTSSGYRAPFLRLDANLVLLHFLSVGFEAMFEFAPTVRLEPNVGDVVDGAEQIDEAFGSIRVFKGPQVFIGPVLGMHFGG